ncbi:MAG TPA: type II toxin-antitoxin system HicA family toxin [Pyrinomonadaceae bacterium]|jgi:predicted RNA binding protein YcfA (HicA-like mRNA interferase family)|nr:type II toxin-antitoxin system HicA family toxin [Pyrinomonadaceae bacterium]
MPKVAPIKRKDLIYYFRKLGFDGPFAGGKHASMLKGNLSLTIPNPHKGQEYSKGFLLKLLKQAEIDRDTWEKL